MAILNKRSCRRAFSKTAVITCMFWNISSRFELPTKTTFGRASMNDCYRITAKLKVEGQHHPLSSDFLIYYNERVSRLRIVGITAARTTN